MQACRWLDRLTQLQWIRLYSSQCYKIVSVLVESVAVPIHHAHFSSNLVSSDSWKFLETFHSAFLHWPRLAALLSQDAELASICDNFSRECIPVRKMWKVGFASITRHLTIEGLFPDVLVSHSTNMTNPLKLLKSRQYFYPSNFDSPKYFWFRNFIYLVINENTLRILHPKVREVVNVKIWKKFSFQWHMRTQAESLLCRSYCSCFSSTKLTFLIDRSIYWHRMPYITGLPATLNSGTVHWKKQDFIEPWLRKLVE